MYDVSVVSSSTFQFQLMIISACQFLLCCHSNSKSPVQVKFYKLTATAKDEAHRHLDLHTHSVTLHFFNFQIRFLLLFLNMRLYRFVTVCSMI